jgi:phosphoglycerol transferase
VLDQELQSAKKNWPPKSLYYIGLFLLIVGSAHLSFSIHWNQIPWPHMYLNGDDIQVLLQAANSRDTGGLFSFPRIGAPFLFEATDFPLYEPFNFFVIRLLSILTPEPRYLVYFYLLLSMGLSGITAAVLLRRLNISSSLTFVGAVAFALSPYVFARSVGHLMLSATYMLPLCLMAALWINCNAKSSNRRLEWFIFTIGFLTLLQNVYYAFFCMMMVGIAAISGGLIARGWRPVRLGALFFLAIILAFGIVHIDRLSRIKENGSNPAYVTRPISNHQFLGLQLVQLVMPHEQNRIKRIRQLKMDVSAKLSNNFILNDISTYSAGLFGSIGILALMALPFLRRTEPQQNMNWNETFPTGPTLFFLSIYFYTILLYTLPGGLGAFVTVTMPIFHVVNRASILLTLFGIATTCLLLTLAGRKVSFRNNWIRRIWPLGFIGTIGVIYIDQTTDYATSSYYYPYNLTAAERYDNDHAFFQKVESMLQPGQAVFQYPYAEWGGYSPWGGHSAARPVVHTRTLLWSYGGIHNRQGYNWNTDLALQPLSQQLNILQEKGFAAVYVEATAFPKSISYMQYPFDLQTLLDGLKKISPSPAIASDDGQHYLFLLPNWKTAKLQQDCEPYTLGQQLTLNDKSNIRRFLDLGWNIPVADGTWMSKNQGDRAIIKLCLADDQKENLALDLKLFPYVNSSSPQLKIKLYANGTHITDLEWNAPSDINQSRTSTVYIPKAVVEKQTPLTLTFQYSRKGSPEGGGDVLGAKLESLTLRQNTEDK